MRTKDIVIGQRYIFQRAFHRAYGGFERVGIVQGVGMARRTDSGKDRLDGIEIQVVEDGGPIAIYLVLTPAEIKRPVPTPLIEALKHEATTFGALALGDDFYFSAYPMTGLLRDLDRPNLHKVYMKVGARRYMESYSGSVHQVGSTSARAWKIYA